MLRLRGLEAGRRLGVEEGEDQGPELQERGAVDGLLAPAGLVFGEVEKVAVAGVRRVDGKDLVDGGIREMGCGADGLRPPGGHGWRAPGPARG